MGLRYRCPNSVYEGEIRRESQNRADRSRVAEQEIRLALQVMQVWTVHFEPLKYRQLPLRSAAARTEPRPRSSKAPLRSARADGRLLRQLEQSLEAAERKPLSREPCLANGGAGQKGTKAGS